MECPKCGSEMTMASATTEGESWWRCGNGLCDGHGHEKKLDDRWEIGIPTHERIRRMKAHEEKVK